MPTLSTPSSRRCALAALAAVLLVQIPMSQASAESKVTHDPPATRETTYRTAHVDGLSIFYREAGDPRAPTLVMLHGFPSSSVMYRDLFPLLSDSFHLIAMDYPGFGLSDAPAPKDFAYTFDHLAAVVDHFLQSKNITRYSLLMQDYGGPVGFRLALAHPERIQTLIVQNAVAHEQGLSPLWEERKAFWKDRKAHEAALASNLLSLEATKKRHVGSSPHPEQIDPGTWLSEFAFLNQPGMLAIQTELFYDYRTNVASYPKWQAYLREKHPPLLVLWGRHDQSFTVAGALAYGDDVPDAEIHLLDAGHFALDEATPRMAWLIREFLERKLSPRSSSSGNGW